MAKKNPSHPRMFPKQSFVDVVKEEKLSLEPPPPAMLTEKMIKAKYGK